MERYAEIIARSTLFEGVDSEAIPGLLQNLQAELKSYGEGAVILQSGGAAGQIGILLAGGAFIWREEYTGRTTLQGELEPGDMFAEVFACAGIAKLPVSVVAVKPAKVLFLEYSRMLVCGCGHSDTLVHNLLADMARKNLALNSLLGHLSRRTLREKLLSYLAEQAAITGGNTFTVPHSRQQMADLLCADRSALSAELARMQKAGLIEYRKSRFTLCKPGPVHS